MRVFKTRPLAIRAACEMLSDPSRQDVQVGPMLDEMPVLSGDDPAYLRDNPGRPNGRWEHRVIIASCTVLPAAGDSHGSDAVEPAISNQPTPEDMAPANVV